MALTSIFPTKTAIKPLFYRQTNPGDVVSDSVLEGNAAKELQEVYQQGFFVDASLSEDYDFSSEVTDNPVEKGLNVTDGINIRPISISLTMKHSDTPIKLSDIFSGLGTSLGAQVGRQIGPLAAQAGGVAAGAFTQMLQQNKVNQRTRSKTMYDQFISLWENKSVMTIQTGLSIYRDLVIERFAVNRGPADGKSLKFTVQLRQIRVVESDIIQVTAPMKEVNVSDKAKPKADLGRQSGKGVNNNKASILAQIFGVS